MAAERWLIVNADDFGRSEGINRGVLRAHRDGIVTSASLMVRHPAAEQAAKLAAAHPELGLGLHVDVGEWVFRDDAWHLADRVVDLNDADAIRAEVSLQLERFRLMTGGEPTHLDSHQHAHRREPLRSILSDLARRLDIPLRQMDSRVRFCGSFFGQTSTGAAYPAGITTAALIALLERLPQGCTELACHPGGVEELDLVYRLERLREVHALCDPATRRAIASAGIRLRSFRGLLADLDARPDLVDEPGSETGRRRPRSPTPLIRTGYRQRREGRLTAALATFERAADFAPSSEPVQRGIRTVASEISVLRDGWHARDERHEWIAANPGRILHLVGRSLPQSWNGYAIRTACIVRAQRAAGLDPHVVTQLGFPPDGESDVELVEGIPHYRLIPSRTGPMELSERLAESHARLVEIVRRVRPAVLHAASDYRNALLALTLGRRFGLPVVYEMRGFWEETRLAKQGSGAAEHESYRWHRRREIQCARDADRVVTLSRGMMDYLVDLGVDRGRIHVIPNAVDPGMFAPVERDAELASRLGIQPGEVVLGYISTFARYEGIPCLIDAAAQLAREGRPVKCLLVGDGDERAALEARARALGIADRVIFTGRVPHGEILSYYGLIDVFVVPRTADRVCQLVTPLKPYEAMSAALPLVVSGVDALREMVEEGVTGITFPPEDPAGLAATLRPLLEDADLRRAMGRAARAWVRRNRTWRLNGERYLDLYRSIGGGPEVRIPTESRIAALASTFTGNGGS